MAGPSITCANYKLCPYPLAGSVAGDKGLTAIPGREQEFKDVLKTAIEYANALKCPRYVYKISMPSHIHEPGGGPVHTVLSQTRWAWQLFCYFQV